MKAILASTAYLFRDDDLKVIALGAAGMPVLDQFGGATVGLIRSVAKHDDEHRVEIEVELNGPPPDGPFWIVPAVTINPETRRIIAITSVAITRNPADPTLPPVTL